MDRCKWDSCAAKNISPMLPEKITSLNVTIYYPEALACKEYPPQVCLCMVQSLPDPYGTTKDVASTQGMSLLGLLERKDISWLKHSLNSRLLKLDAWKAIQKGRFNTQGMPLFNACIQMPVASSLRIPLSAVTCPEDPAFISLGPTWNMPIEWRALDCLAKCKSATMDHIQCYRFYMCFGSRLFCENIWEAVSWFNIFQNCANHFDLAQNLCFFVILWSVPFCSWKRFERLQNYSHQAHYTFLSDVAQWLFATVISIQYLDI